MCKLINKFVDIFFSNKYHTYRVITEENLGITRQFEIIPLLNLGKIYVFSFKQKQPTVR